MLTKAEHELRMALYKQGKTDVEIAEETHYSRQAIYLWRKRNNLKHNYNGLLKGIDYRAMDEMIKSGISQSKIAKALGCSETLVYLRKNGKVGKTVEV